MMGAAEPLDGHASRQRGAQANADVSEAVAAAGGRAGEDAAEVLRGSASAGLDGQRLP